MTTVCVKTGASGNPGDVIASRCNFCLEVPDLGVTWQTNFLWLSAFHSTSGTGRGRQWQTTPGLKNCLGNPDTGSPGVYADSKELLLLLVELSHKKEWLLVMSRFSMGFIKNNFSRLQYKSIEERKAVYKLYLQSPLYNLYFAYFINLHANSPVFHVGSTRTYTQNVGTDAANKAWNLRAQGNAFTDL